jgi:hypothetical protein
MSNAEFADNSLKAIFDDPAAMAALLDEDPAIAFFKFAHLPAHLQEMSELFGGVALSVISMAPAGPQRMIAIQKLLEAKDAAVRALLAAVSS